MRRLLPTFLLLLVPSTAGCGRFAPEEATRFSPPAEYLAWWNATEACSGRHASMSRVTWFKVPGEGFACPTGMCVGRWEDNHTIYVAEAYLDHEMVVRHEMLHDLLDAHGHPDPPFGQPCPLTWSTWTGPGAGLRADAPMPGLD